MRTLNIAILLLFFPLIAFSTIFESDTFFIPLIDEEAWVFCAIDNTLIESKKQLSAQWRNHVRQKAQCARFDKQNIEEIVDHFWFFVQPFISVRPVDPCAHETTYLLSNKCASLIALTARDPSQAEYTLGQLEEACITLSNDKVIYCGRKPKDEALLSFFKELRFLPKKNRFC